MSVAATTRCAVLAALLTALGPLGCTVVCGTRCGRSCPEPAHAFRVELELDGVSQGMFDEVSGLGSEATVVEYKQGNDASTVRKIPGLKKYTNITLKRGYVQNDDFWAWHEEILSGGVKRRDGAVTFIDEAGTKVLRYEFFGAWPAKWSGPALTGKSNDVAIEEIELTVERIDRVR